MQPINSIILYEDAAVQITENEIVIKNYYSPIPVDKKIPFLQIHDVFLLSKLSSQSSLSSYNPFSPQPQTIQGQKTTYIELWLKDSNSRPTFYPHDPQRVFKLIQTKISQEQFKENINLGMEKVENSAKQTASGFFGKMGKIVQETTMKISQKGSQWSEELKMKSKESMN